MITKWTEITIQANYEALRYSFLRELEGVDTLPYLDSNQPRLFPRPGENNGQRRH